MGELPDQVEEKSAIESLIKLEMARNPDWDIPGKAIVEFAALKKWKATMIDAAIVYWVYRKEHNDDPMLCLDDIFQMNTKMALDPAISKPIADLQSQLAAANEDAAAGWNFAVSLHDAADGEVEFSEEFEKDYAANIIIHSARIGGKG